MGEHQDVGQVEESSKDTDHHGQPAVDRVVEVLGEVISYFPLQSGKYFKTGKHIDAGCERAFERSEP